MLNDTDLDAIIALYADDAVGSATRRGLAEVRAFYAGSPLRLKLQVELEGQIRAVASEAAFTFRVSFEANGQRPIIRPIDVLRFDESSRITQMRAFFGPDNINAG